MQAALQWLEKNHEGIVRNLANLVAVPSISTDGEHKAEIDRTASLTCDQMREAGLHNIDVLRTGDSLPYAYGEWLGAPGKPTVFLYAHHDVQPVNKVGDPKDDWKTDPWKLTRRDGRLFGRGSADDKGAIASQLGAISAYLKSVGNLPVNVKMVVEGEEEIGSRNLLRFFEQHKKRIQSDVIIVCDTENIEIGLPCITYSLRGIVAVQVDVRSAANPVHSGMGGGYIADAAIALNAILSRLFWGNGPLPIPGYYDSVRQLTEKERKSFRALPFDEAAWRKNLGIPDHVRNANANGLHFHEQTWRKPAITVIAQEASSIKGASNQVLPRASAIVSCRIVPDQDPERVQRQITEFLSKDPPWGVEVSVKPAGAHCNWWMTDPNGPAFEAAMAALRSGFGRDAVGIGCGGSIGFVGPLADLFGGAPALLLGIEDPMSNAHAPNESLHEGDFKKLMASLVYLFENLNKLPGGRVR
jgi:acetylornithine deacetylase/succinyl-diaminopimelate desuccinylase-like protein